MTNQNEGRENLGPQSLSLLYFSPTGTTKIIADTMVQKLGVPHVEEINLTDPRVRSGDILVASDLVVFGAPVYEEYLPEVVIDCLRKIQFQGQPVLAFAVYGNIGYGLSLKQIHGELTKKGLSPIALGAFIGEHSFSSQETPLAKGRPDENDKEDAKKLAELFVSRLLTKSPPLAPDEIPGKLPLMARILPKGSAKLFTKPPVINSSCTNCRRCILKCPMGAIDESLFIDEEKCLRCFACVRICGKKAREIKYRKRILVTTMLNMKNRVKKESLLL